MKKLIAMLLAFALVASFGVTAAFAKTAPDADTAFGDIWSKDPTDPGAALYTARATALGNQAKMYDAIATAAAKYEKVFNDPTSTKDQRDKAADTFQDTLDSLKATYGKYVPASMANIFDEAYYNAFSADKTGAEGYNAVWASTQKSTATASKAVQELNAAEALLDNAYQRSQKTSMDASTLAIGIAKLEAAKALADGQAAAAAAKAGAASAQATAKSLINTALAAAKEEAQAAVARAQTDAYNQLSAAYATAVASVWEEVAAYIDSLY